MSIIENRIEQHLKHFQILAPIKEVRAMWKVYLVIFHKGYSQRPRFVSKNAILDDDTVNDVKSYSAVSFRLTCRRRLEGKQWMAKITGSHPKYILNRQFLEADNAEWGKNSWRVKEYKISEPGYYEYYQDGKRFYVEVVEDNQGLLHSNEIEYHHVLQALNIKARV